VRTLGSGPRLPYGRGHMLETENEELGELPYTRCSDPGLHLPAVVIVPSIYGVQTDLLAQMEELAEGDAWVAAMDPFYEERPGPWSYADPDGAIERMQKTDLDQVYEDFVRLVKHARKEGNGKVIGLGICFGGPFCFRAAGEGELDGVVTWHGSRLDAYAKEAARANIPFRLHFGADDRVVPKKQVDIVRSAFEGHKKAEVVMHPGAGHGFSHRDAKGYDPSAEAAAMDAVRDVLALYGSPT